MCNTKVIEFVSSNLSKEEIAGKTVLEVGSRNVNGSAREYIESNHPFKYLGIDIIEGKGVDEICSIYDMTDKLLPFDIVICTDVIEHVEDWCKAVDQLKQITKVNGKIIITVPAIGFPYHGWPYDYWRYTLTDLLYIFRDFLILNYKQVDRGVFVKLKKVYDYTINLADNSDYKLYSILRGCRIKNLTRFDKSMHYPRKIQRSIAKRLRKAIVYILPRFVKDILTRIK